MRPVIRVSLGLGLVLLMSAISHAAIPDKDLQQIAAASPDKPTATPVAPRKLLVFSWCAGYKHASIPYGEAALRIMGEKTGAYQAIISEDPDMFKPQTLREFDAVCFNNSTGELFGDPALKQSLMDFVKSGKGVVGIHAATDCFYNWPEFGEMMGGYFDGHPWHEKVGIKVDDPDHPVTAAFGGKPFNITDEIYQLRMPYSRHNLRVLLSLDTDKTDMSKKGIHRTDGDFAVSWVRSYGKGRVFYCSLGHRNEIFWNPTVLRHYLDGIQFAMGDLPADTTPSSKPASAGWVPLFNGRDLTGWKLKEGSWVVDNGTLARKGGGDIWTEERFGDFVLDLEFKVAPKSNSGIFFRTGNLRDCVQTGIELQVLDSYGKPEPSMHDCGAIYDCLAPRKNMVKAPGEWNRVRLTCQGSKVVAVLNGEQIIDMDLDDWTEAHKNPDGTKNKFRTAYKDMPRAGHIGFQDHGAPVWYRNVYIRQLK